MHIAISLDLMEKENLMILTEIPLFSTEKLLKTLSDSPLEGLIFKIFPCSQTLYVVRAEQ